MKSSIRLLAFATLLTASLVLPAAAETLKIFAAASLTEAFNDIGALYKEQNPGAEIEFNFAGSQVLRTQIEEGAPADVFVSADHVHMQALQATHLAGDDQVIATNRLVVVTPMEKARVKRLADLARPGVTVVIANANVPVGRYTMQALARMNMAGLYGDDFQRRFTANVVSQESNVRGVLAKVSLDEADAGVVYLTDARAAAEKVRLIDIPERMNVVAEYPIAVVSASGAKEAAARFIALVQSEAGQAILAARGFLPAR
ncbi:MAG TPA: molybdate ABC transporter substrate-binding protein [Candidatus Eisenbacteria bacterium]